MTWPCVAVVALLATVSACGGGPSSERPRGGVSPATGTEAASRCSADSTVTLVAEPGATTTGWAQSTLNVPANTAFKLCLRNKDSDFHNVVVFEGESPSDSPVRLFNSGRILDPGQEATYDVQPIPPGKHFFWCAVHAQTMRGYLVAA
jgi:plastocyanin